MVAAAFKGVVSFQGIDGTQMIEPFSCSDVANAFATFDSSGLTFVNLPCPASLVDIVENTGGTDTTKTRIWFNNKDTGLTYLNKSILDTINNRVPLPIKFGNPQTMQGGQFQIKQLA